MGKPFFFCAGAKKETLPTATSCNILFNVVENGRTSTRTKKAKEISDLPKVNQVMLDSSGFSILTAETSNKHITSDPTRPLSLSKTEMNIAPLHVVQTACELQPHVMVSLDYPLRKFQTQREQRLEFKKKLLFNIKWAVETSLLRDKHCPNISLFVPVQAYTLQDFTTFEASIRGVNFDGFSLPIRNLGLQEIALFLFAFYKTGIKKVHLLGTSSFFTIALAAYFSNHYFSWVSFDSRSWRIAAEHGEYLNPLNLCRESIRVENIRSKERLQKYCACPVCKRHSLTSIRGYPYPKRIALLRNHNFFATVKVVDDLHLNATSLPKLEMLLKGRSPRIKHINELIRSLSLIKYLKDKDINVTKPPFKIAA